MRVAREEHPAEGAPGTVVDHETHQTLAEPVAAVVLHDEDVGEVCEAHPVRDGAGESDLLAGVGSIGAHHSPGAGDLRLDVGAGAVATPIRLRRQPGPDGVGLQPRRVVIEFVVHRTIVARLPDADVGPEG